MFRALCSGLVALAALVATGCGKSEPTGPKETLDEQQQQQVKDLNEQRQDEWKSTKTKNK